MCIVVTDAVDSGLDWIRQKGICWMKNVIFAQQGCRSLERGKKGEPRVCRVFERKAAKRESALQTVSTEQQTFQSSKIMWLQMVIFI